MIQITRIARQSMIQDASLHSEKDQIRGSAYVQYNYYLGQPDIYIYQTKYIWNAPSRVKTNLRILSTPCYVN